MKNLKAYCIILLFIILLSFSTISFADEKIQIDSNKTVVEAGEEFEINIKLNNEKIASCTLEIYFDSYKLEYVSGPTNSNNTNHRIIYTWISSSGKDIENMETDGFKFKALQNGTANIYVLGEFYNSNGEFVNVENNNLEIRIGKENVVEIENEQNSNVSDDNTNLGILRLNEEGISPDFDKDIKEYYFIANPDINSLDITAIPENPNANVSITGNTDFKQGENIVNIEVLSKDKTKTSTYKIYVTKTNDIELANANLETLAIRNVELKPEFNNNMTKYLAEVSTDTSKIDILAVPENENAKVKILGNNAMEIGDNLIEIIVTAENGTTTKKYNLTVHRRNGEEEINHEQEMEYQAEKLYQILENEELKYESEEQSKNFDANDKNEKIKNNIFVTIIIIIVFTSAVVSVSVYYFKKNKYL